MIELSEIDDERIHPAVISPDGKILTIYKDVGLQFPDLDGSSDFGYIVVNGIGSKRQIENESNTEFGNKLMSVLKKPFLKVIII